MVQKMGIVLPVDPAGMSDFKSEMPRRGKILNMMFA